MQLLQEEVFFSTMLILVLSAALAAYITYRYSKARKAPLLYWSIGLWLFAFDVLLEVLFADNLYTNFLIDTYLFTVALIVFFLAYGSVRMLGSRKASTYYAAFGTATSAFLLYSIIATAGTPAMAPSSMLKTYVMAGNPPLLVILGSLIVTFPAAAILIVVAAISYRKRRSYKMLSIIAGTLIVSVAGTLYIASIPEFLYYSEFIGILLLWIGFV